MANGPRMPEYLNYIESKINQSVYPLESDANMCVWGEEYALDGSLRNINNAYYLGGGTGTADGLKLKSKLVPFDQISRCMNWTENFTIYNNRKVIFAFKFLSKKRIGKGEYEKRELREYYKIWDSKHPLNNIVCKYDGSVYGLNDGKKVKVKLNDYQMPFSSRHQKFLEP